MGLITPQDCSKCIHANMCQDKAVFQAMQNYTNLLVGTNAAVDGDGNVRDHIRVRVEYRYVNGPELERLYKELGMDGWGQVPCSAPGHRHCPLMRRFPFDNPIYAPFPHVADTVTHHLCHSSHDNHGHRLPYFMENAHIGTLGDCHVSHYAGKNWWSCYGCKMRGHVHAEIDYAQLGGSVYSTFFHTTVEGKVGDTIKLMDLPIPQHLSPDYAPSQSNPESFTLTSEEESIIVYYEYIGLPAPVLPDETPKPEDRTSTFYIVTPDRYIYAGNPKEIGGITILLDSATLNGVKKPYNRVIFNNLANPINDAHLYEIGKFTVGTLLRFTIFLDNEDWQVDADTMIMVTGQWNQMEKSWVSTTNSGKKRFSTTICMTVGDETTPNVLRPVFVDTRLSRHRIKLSKFWYVQNGPKLRWDSDVNVPGRVPPRLLTPVEGYEYNGYPTILPPPGTVVRQFFSHLGYTKDMYERHNGEPVTLMPLQNIELEPDSIPTGLDSIVWVDASVGSIPEDAIGAMWKLNRFDVDMYVTLALQKSLIVAAGKTMQRMVFPFDIYNEPAYDENGDPMILTTQYSPDICERFMNALASAVPEGFDAYVVPVPKDDTILGVSVYSNFLSEKYHTAEDFIPAVFMRKAINPAVDIRYDSDPITGQKFIGMPVIPTKLNDWMLTLAELKSLNRLIFFLVPNAENQMGIRGVNFFHSELILKWIPQDTQMTYFIRGTEMRPNLSVLESNQPFINPETLLGHTLSDIYPEDAEEVYVIDEPSGNAISLKLGGARAPFYSLSDKVKMDLVEPVTIDGRIEGTPQNCETRLIDETSTICPYMGEYITELVAPPNMTLARIEVVINVKDEFGAEQDISYVPVNRKNGVEEFNTSIPNIGIYNHRALAMEVEGLNGNGTYKLHMPFVLYPTKIHTYWVPTAYADPGDKCERCDGYLDASDYPSIHWTPECENYAE